MIFGIVVAYLIDVAREAARKNEDLRARRPSIRGEQLARHGEYCSVGGPFFLFLDSSIEVGLSL